MVFISALERRYGPFGPEGLRLREQLWLLPSPDPTVALRSTLFRPEQTTAKLPLVVINHGTPGSHQARSALPLPSYFYLSKWFVDRGFAVLLPQRRGHGATGGGHAETFRQPHGVDFIAAGQNGADDISAAVNYMRKQKFIDGANISLVGVSSGGWASLALASRNPPFIRAAINFAGGRGGRVRGIANQNIAPEKLVEASAFFGQLARIPSLWIYAKSDKHFGPDLAQRLYQAWEKGGAPTEFHLLPDVGADGHNLVARADGISIYGPLLEDFVNNVVCAAGDRAAIELCPNNDLWLRRPRFPERISKLSLPVPLMLICNALLQFTRLLSEQEPGDEQSERSSNRSSGGGVGTR